MLYFGSPYQYNKPLSPTFIFKKSFLFFSSVYFYLLLFHSILCTIEVFIFT